MKTLPLFLLVAALVFMGCTAIHTPPANPGIPETTIIPQVSNPSQLDSRSVFSFAIMSDNKGDGPDARKEFANMVHWIQNSNAQFVIGMGDHLKQGWRNDFLEFLASDSWWRSHFLPGIADGENEFYGESQGDWGAGRKIMELVDPAKNIKLEVQENGVDYYAAITVDAYTVHWIHGHFPDTPEDPIQAFPQSTRDFLVNQVRKIDKGPRDIIIVGAHSYEGFWIQLMTDLERELLMTKADLILSATTHFFERRAMDGFEGNGALVINTGSVTYPTSYCPPGYLQINVLENPLRLIVQYVDAGKTVRELQFERYALVKVINGQVYPASLRPMRPEEDHKRVVATIDNDISAEELSTLVQQISLDRLQASVSLIVVEDGLAAGPVTVEDLWRLAPFNNKVSAVKLTKEQWAKVLRVSAPEGVQEPFILGIDAYSAARITNRLSLDPEHVVTTEISEQDLILEAIAKANQLAAQK